MLNILIIDDSERKNEQYRNLISKYPEIPTANISICRDLISAKQSLISNLYDLVILDIQIPNRPGGLPIRYGGYELLKEIHSRSCYKKPLCIVGVTEYLDLYEELIPLFTDRLWNIISYDEANDLWSTRLDCKIQYLLESKRTDGSSDLYKCDIGIITALLVPEFDQLFRLIDWKSEPVENDDTKYFRSAFITEEKNLSVIAATTPQMGMPAAAVTATKLIFHFRPKYLCMIGITAGVRDKVRLGDIIVADPSWDWGSGKLKAEGKEFVLEPDPLPERLHPRMRAMFQDASLDHSLYENIVTGWEGNRPANDPVLHVGPSASGSCVIADGLIVRNIQAHSRKLIGVEMENYAIMHAAANAIAPQPKAFTIKAVCDYADNEKNDDIQAYAAYASATVLKRIALKYL